MKKTNYILPVAILLVVGVVLFLNNITSSFAKDNTEDLKKQIEVLQKRVDELESEKQETQAIPPRVFNGRKIHRWDPFNEMERMQQQFNSIFDESFDRGMRSRGFDSGFQGIVFEPDIDIHEEKKQYIAKIDLPGMEKDKINIEVKDHMLMISGERETLVEENGEGKFFRQERSYGHFSKTFPLPEDAKDNEIAAEYKNGVLIVKIPREKSEEKTEDSKKINIM